MPVTWGKCSNNGNRLDDAFLSIERIDQAKLTVSIRLISEKHTCLTAFFKRLHQPANLAVDKTGARQIRARDIRQLVLINQKFQSWFR